MPQQAILDLPVIEFEPWRDAPERLHAHCIETYGINGLTPHNDAVFHFAASLWRYRQSETPRQVAGLAAGYLAALASRVAARRRLAAARAASRAAKRQREAEFELQDAAYHLEEVSGAILEYVCDMLDLAASHPAESRERLAANLRELAEPGCADELEHWSGTLIVKPPAVRWSDDLLDILDGLEDGEANADPDDIDPNLYLRMQEELAEYREIAAAASARLQRMDSERRELEELLARTESDFSQRSAALMKVHGSLEETLTQARQRLENLEQESAQLTRVKAERDQLATELVSALGAAADHEVAREDLLLRLDTVSSSQAGAADAIGNLSGRLEALQADAEATAERADAYRKRLGELEDQLAQVRAELAQAQTRNAKSDAALAELNSARQRQSETEALLTEAEAKLADAQDKLEEAEAERDSNAAELAKAREAGETELQALRSELDETQALDESRQQRIAQLERELARATSDLSKVTGHVEVARSTEKQLRNEVESLRKRLLDSDDRVRAAENAQAEVQAELEGLRTSRDELASRLGLLEESATDAERHLKERDEQAQDARSRLTAANERIAGLETALEQARNEAAEGARADAQNGIETVRAELARMKAERADVDSRLAELNEQHREAQDLAADRARKAAEKISLLNERVARLDNERKLLAETLALLEQGREYAPTEGASKDGQA